MRVIQNDNDKSNKLYIPLRVFTSNDFVSTILNNHDLIHTLVGPTFMTPVKGLALLIQEILYHRCIKPLRFQLPVPQPVQAGFLNHPQYHTSITTPLKINM